MGPYRVLYLDMNGYYASITQQMEPNLRGRPVAITAMEGDYGACVAASYEAKAYGIKTGTSVRDARLLCPEIVFRPSRHRLYVRYSLRIADVLDRHAELYRIRSVDEFQLVLSGSATNLDGARDLVSRLKRAVADEVGACLRFSAGIGPNALLAKTAGKLEKPDGFQWLSSDNMPERLSHLKLDDLPGISTALRQRLERAGVRDIPDLWRLDPRHARAIWRSVEGERFVRALQGDEIPLVSTNRGGYGNSKVLAPEFRSAPAAYLVSKWLVEKAVARLRRDGRVAGSFGFHISLRKGSTIGKTIRCAQSQDTAAFLRINRRLWQDAWKDIRGFEIVVIGVYLGHVGLLRDRNGDLLTPVPPSERTKGERAAQAVDFINDRFGPGSITYGHLDFSQNLAGRR